MSDFKTLFESKVKQSLSLFCNPDCSKIAAAVSGGADSVSLLVSLSNIVPKQNLFVVTVNHNLRPKEQTEGDALYVQSLCEKLGVFCKRYDVERGLIKQKSVDFKCGIEEAARRIRYEIFDSFIEQNGIQAFCLAHNKDDDAETSLMNFLRGSSVKSMAGIPKSRGVYFRPLLSISRSQIELYLQKQNIGFKTDMTNYDDSILRNLIRHKLIPFLDENMKWWRSGIETTKQKLLDANLILSAHDEELKKKCSYTVKKNCGEVYASLLAEEFFLLHEYEQRNLLLIMLDDVKPFERVGREFLTYACKALLKEGGTASSSGVQFVRKNDLILVQRQHKVATEKGFFVIIDCEGTFCAGPWQFCVSRKNGFVCLDCGTSRVEIPNVEFPLAIKSCSSGDFFRTKDAGIKYVSDVLKEWKCGEKKQSVPIVVSLSSPSPFKRLETVCIFASVAGFKDRVTANEYTRRQ